MAPFGLYPPFPLPIHRLPRTVQYRTAFQAHLSHSTQDTPSPVTIPGKHSMPELNARLLRLLRKYCDATAIAAVVLGCLVLCAWAFHIDRLGWVFSGLLTVKANTGVGIGLCGISLWLLLRNQSSTPRGRL